MMSENNSGRERRGADHRPTRGQSSSQRPRQRAGELSHSRRPAPIKIQPARQIAFEVLRAVAEDDAYANLVLPSKLREAQLPPADAALATELTYGTLRRQGTYDAVIAVAAGRSTHEIDPAVLDALRIGVHQLLSTRVAPHAAVNESVSLVTQAAGRGASGFANAVLRRVAERDEQQWLEQIESAARSDDERLGLRTAHPVWIIRALRRALAAEGREDELEDLLAADNVSPDVTLVALPGLAELDAEARPYAPTAFALGGGDPAPVVAAHGGRVRVQDEGSQLVALALVGAAPVQPGEKWLDLCAGPGGKTALLAAEALRTGATLTANEPVPTRARLVRKALRSVPLEVSVLEQDGREVTGAASATYDRILIDAPCTGLGALRRRPEARWRKTAQDVADLVGLQEQLLSGALDALAPGGIAAYVTCSPHLAETAGVVATVLQKRDDVTELDARAAIAAVASQPIDLAVPVDGSGRAQLWPHRHGTDAMFLALIRKNDTPAVPTGSK